MRLKILKISQGEKEVWPNVMDDRSIRALGVVASWSAAEGCSKVRNNLTPTQVTSDPRRQVKVIWGGLRVCRVTAMRHSEMRSLERRGGRREKRRDKGVTAVSSHSVTPGLAVFTELSVTW